MSDLKDSAIKLFGKTILLPVSYNPHLFSTNNKESLGSEEDLTTTTTTSSSSESESNKKAKTCSPDRQGDETSGEENNILQKPDKIVACPRCNSMDTKFCYYNNYNVNQPRHFCKKCQRYWTAGGTMRNVPVGAGRRRKNKNSSASHFRHLILLESIRSTQLQQASFNPTFTYSLGKRSSREFGGIENQQQHFSPDQFNRAGLLKGFSQSKSDDDRSFHHNPETSLLFLQANPAALYRSLNFLETN